MSSFYFFFHSTCVFISAGNFVGDGFRPRSRAKTNVSGKFYVLHGSGLRAALPGRNVVIAVSDFYWYLKGLPPLQWTVAVPNQDIFRPSHLPPMKAPVTAGENSESITNICIICPLICRIIFLERNAALPEC